MSLFVPKVQPTAGGVAQMVERPLCMREAQGSIPCSSTLFFGHIALFARENTTRTRFWVADDTNRNVVGALAQW
jgi:hypothetical protein